MFRGKFTADKEGTKIVRENNRWFVVLPRIVNIKKPENQRLGVVALDPGVRTFQTYFSPFAFSKIGAGGKIVDRDLNGARGILLTILP